MTSNKFNYLWRVLFDSLRWFWHFWLAWFPLTPRKSLCLCRLKILGLKCWFLADCSPLHCLDRKLVDRSIPDRLFLSELIFSKISDFMIATAIFQRVLDQIIAMLSLNDPPPLLNIECWVFMKYYAWRMWRMRITWMNRKQRGTLSICVPSIRWLDRILVTRLKEIFNLWGVWFGHCELLAMKREGIIIKFNFRGEFLF